MIFRIYRSPRSKIESTPIAADDVRSNRVLRAKGWQVVREWDEAPAAETPEQPEQGEQGERPAAPEQSEPEAKPAPKRRAARRKSSGG